MDELRQKFSALPMWGKAAGVVIVLGLMMAVYSSLIQSELSEQLQAAKQQNKTLEDQIRDAERREKQYLELTQELSERESTDQQNRRILPEDAEIAGFLQDLNRVAELSGLEIRLVEPRPEEKTEMYAKIPVALAVTGRFHQLGKFFYNVSKLDRAISMENIRMSRPRTLATGEVVLDVDVRATTYRRATTEEKGN
jgi:type IV pilus assembly protein PilO